MLRLRPTVISLTRTDVTEVVHRRRFRRFLECDDNGAYIAATPAETEAICDPTRSKPSSSRMVDREAIRPTCNGTRDSSLSPLYNRVRPLVADLPLVLPSDKGTEEDHSLPVEESDGRGRYPEAKDEPQQSSAWAPQLCLRPKRGPDAASTNVVDIELDSSTDSHHSLEDPRQESPDVPARRSESRRRFPGQGHLPVERADTRSKSEAGPSTPRRTSSPASSFGSSPPPALSRRVRPVRNPHDQYLRLLTWREASLEPFDDSDRDRNLERSHEFSSPPAACETRGRVRVYNDRLPASSQPQTPSNLPEARHQSRLDGSYTAPARHSSPRPAWTPTVTRSRRGFRGREPSPPGIQTPGFTGLYGGMENMDDEGFMEAEEMVEMRRTWASTSHSSA